MAIDWKGSSSRQEGAREKRETSVEPGSGRVAAWFQQHRLKIMLAVISVISLLAQGALREVGQRLMRAILGGA